MQDILDIQRDQTTLINGAMALLAAGGTLYFSNNLRSFELNPQLEAQYRIQNITRQSIPEDFRNKKNPPMLGNPPQMIFMLPLLS